MHSFPPSLFVPSTLLPPVLPLQRVIKLLGLLSQQPVTLPISFSSQFFPLPITAVFPLFAFFRALFAPLYPFVHALSTVPAALSVLVTSILYLASLSVILILFRLFDEFFLILWSVWPFPFLSCHSQLLSFC